MAVYNGIYKILNNEGTYDVVNLRTTAEQVVESSNKRFVTDAEKSTWNSKANASHTHTSAQITDATNANTANMIVKRDAYGNFSAGTITATLSGNASSATKLATARTINGTSFNGSANITTALWGTARTITIGSTGKSVNGSGDISWSLSEIGAAPSSHTHSYLPLSGGTLTGNAIFNNNVGVQGKNTSGTAYSLAVVNDSNQAFLGNTSLATVIASSSNPKAKVGSNEYTIYHTGNKPTASDVGALTQSAADNRYRQKTDLVFVDTISIVTPAT